MSVFIGGIGSTRKLKSLTSNQYYGGMNRRYDKRVSKMLKQGWKLDRETMTWHYKSLGRMKNALHNTFVYHADGRAFEDEMKRMML